MHKTRPGNEAEEASPVVEDISPGLVDNRHRDTGCNPRTAGVGLVSHNQEIGLPEVVVREADLGRNDGISDSGTYWYRGAPTAVDLQHRWRLLPTRLPPGFAFCSRGRVRRLFHLRIRSTTFGNSSKLSRFGADVPRQPGGFSPPERAEMESILAATVFGYRARKGRNS
jgi:hypothetical protein